MSETRRDESKHRTVVRQLGKDTAVYSIGNALTRMVGFLLIPIYTRYLSTEDYGNFSLLLVLLTLLLTIATQGIGTAFLREVPSASSDDEKISLQSSALIYLSVSSLIVAGLVAVFAAPVGELLLGTQTAIKGTDPATLVRLVALVALLQIVSVVPMQQLVATRMAFQFMWISLLSFSLQVGLNIWFVVAMDMGVQGIMLGMASAAACTAGLALLINRRLLDWTVSLSTVRRLVRFGLPLIPVGLCFWVIQVSDRILLKQLSTDAELGLYSLGARFADLLRVLLIAPFSVAWGAFCFRIAEQEDAKATFARLTTTVLIVISALGVVMMALLTPILKIAAAGSFWDAARVVPVLIVSNVFYGAFLVIDLGIYITKKTYLFPYIMIAGTAVNIGLNLLLIPTYGMMGAALASVAAYFLIIIITYRMSQKLYPIDYPIGRLCVLGLLLGVATAVTCYLATLDPLPGLLLALVLIAGFLGLMSVCGIVQWRATINEFRTIFMGRSTDAGVSGGGVEPD